MSRQRGQQGQRTLDIRIPPYTPVPLNRYQDSLEGFIDLSDDTPQPLSAENRESATAIMNALLSAYGNNWENIDRSPKFEHAVLIQEFFNRAAEPVGRDNFLRYFLSWLIGSSSIHDAIPDLPSASQFQEALSELGDFPQWNKDRQMEMLLRVKDFSEHLVYAFFEPLKASGGRTPKPSARSSSVSPVAGTPSRLATLRENCLVRDHHRCVVSRAFDDDEYSDRYEAYGNNAKDDDGKVFSENETTAALEVAHIIPHSFLSLRQGEEELSDSKINALTILEMFAPGIKRKIEGPQVDRPFNAISLTSTLHGRFGRLNVYFDEIQDSRPHTYTIKTFTRMRGLPVVRPFLSSPSYPVDMPDRQLLAIHRDCAKILHLSGAREYIEQLLDSFGDGTARADGQSDLGAMVSLRMYLTSRTACSRA